MRTSKVKHNKPVTLKEVAEYTGVSVMTVSNVVRGWPYVSDEMRERVQEAIQTLGYHPSKLARSLATGRTNFIAIIMANMSNPFYATVLDLFTSKLQALGFWVQFSKVTGQEEVDNALLAALQYRVDGIILTSAALSSQVSSEYANQGTPVVLFNRYELDSPASAVFCDSVAAGRLVAEKLVGAGHRRLAYVAGMESSSTNRDRETGFTERLRELGITSWLREQGDFGYESGFAAGQKLAGLPEPPQAIFCANDMMAMGVLDAVRVLCEPQVSEDIAIVGFDDISMAGWSKYSLTTVRQPVERMVNETIEVLTTAIESPDSPAVTRVIPTELVIRQSARLEADERADAEASILVEAA